MTDFVLSAPAGDIDAVVELPSGEGPWPAVVVVHDSLGVIDDLRNILRRIAAKGYIAVAPNLYSRGGPALCVTKVFRDMLMGKGRAVDDLLAAKEWALAREDCTGKVGVAGFCLGGGFALVLSTKGFGAAAPFYGILPRNINEALDNACPIVASYGKRDPSLIGAGAKLEKTLAAKGIPHDVKTYDGVGHSFANELPMQPLLRIAGFGFGREQSEDAWVRVFGFFGTHLSQYS